MKKMTAKINRYLLLLALLLACMANSYAQGGWVSVIAPRGGFAFQMPEQPSVTDTLDLLSYIHQPDTNTSLQAHYIDKALIEENSEDFNNFLQQAEGDTLRAMGIFMITAAEAELVSSEDIVIYQNGIPIRGLEIGMRVRQAETSVDENDIYTFTRIYYLGGSRFYGFTISGMQLDLLQIMELRNIFFGSIQFF
jgi:hypothetical protein